MEEKHEFTQESLQAFRDKIEGKSVKKAQSHYTFYRGTECPWLAVSCLATKEDGGIIYTVNTFFWLGGAWVWSQDYQGYRFDLALEKIDTGLK